MTDQAAVRARGRSAVIAAGLAIVLAAAVIPAIAFLMVYRYTIDIPFWDEWGYAPMIVAARDGHILWSVAWGQHNEHRIFFPALIMVGLARLGGWSELRETLFDVGVTTIQLAVVWLMVASTLPRASAPYVFLGASLMTFSLVQVENMFWGMGLGRFLLNALALLAFYRLTRPALVASDVAIALAACIVAACSSSEGLMAFPVALLVLVLRDSPKLTYTAVWTVGSAMFLSLYLHGLDQRHESPAGGDQIGPAFAHYFLTYLGAPLGSFAGVPLDEVLGAFALCVVLAGAVRFGALRSANKSATAYLLWLAPAAFVVGNALVTAYARIAKGPDQATASRYTTIATDLWLAVIALLVLLAADASKRGRPARRMVAAVATAHALGFAYLEGQTQLSGFASIGAFTTQIKEGMYAVRIEQHPEAAGLLSLYPDAAFLCSQLAELAAAGDEQVGRTCESTGRGK
jgi:hypothetical protein